jgi:branched-chain amino acid transport system permease protein
MQRAPLVALGLLAAFIAPIVFYPVFLMECLCYALFASAFNLLFGCAGLLSFGHAAFFGTGAYLAGFVAKSYGVSPEISLVAGVLAATTISVPLGYLATRREGVYFSMITFALGQLVYFIAVQAPFTGGEDGLQSVPRGKFLGLIDLNDERGMYYFVSCVFVMAFLAIYRIINSPFGTALAAIRENEQRAISLGYKVELYKITSFILSASFCGLAGGLKVLTFHFSSLNNVYWHQSGEVVLMTLLGGAGTLFGPTIGAVFVVFLQHYLSGLGEWVTFILGGIFVVCVLSFRQGVVGAVQGTLRSRRLRAELSARTRNSQIEAWGSTGPAISAAVRSTDGR